MTETKTETEKLYARLVARVGEEYDSMTAEFDEAMTNLAADLVAAAELALVEAATACLRYPPFHSAHEAFAVLKEEVDELWDAIKVNDAAQARAEAVQVAAMAVRFLAEIDNPAVPAPTRSGSDS